LNRRLPGFITLLVLAVAASGVAVVYAKYLSRKHFVELQALRGERDELAIRWGRLQLEESTLAAYSRVEASARDRLNMRLPRAGEVVVLREH
jgi:cell division protein FtsL